MSYFLFYDGQNRNKKKVKRYMKGYDSQIISRISILLTFCLLENLEKSLINIRRSKIHEYNNYINSYEFKYDSTCYIFFLIIKHEAYRVLDLQRLNQF